ncbi:methane monooxygenase/ammonia monooxygenase subunit B [Bradyrhizobium sp. AC87j1]|uniref:bacterial ammonia monooxygenase, subunit AmoB n=1 Tax=Bradyrhizobium sp. AC87j1 TaxID=2055894 RepID=UPI000CEC2DAC|nr:bacterial ammonia monooxygenase, subunit AmoB [Bradyrhizobium sp. AC87j1]PPQ14298.1 methane monooxygenase/ammonia monooxygenase subunit B [Bradyrhizobium sp. AC87j1]
MLSQLIKLAAGWLVAFTAGVSSAAAHGERAQEPYLRTRTVQFYDVYFSKTDVKVNERFELTGKFRLMEDWPDAVTPPDIVFVSSVSPGPTIARVETYLNGEPARQSFAKLELGRDYDFRMVLEGRTPGSSHIHPSISIKGSGPLVGPGQWINISGDAHSFAFPIKTMTGLQIDDLQTFGLTNAIGWHVAWLAVAAAWLLFWLVRPLFLPRWLVLQKGREDLLVSLRDTGVGIIVAAIVLVMVFGGYVRANQEYPYNVPLQSGLNKVAPRPASPADAEVKVISATYEVPGRSMRLATRITNKGSEPLSIGELTTANIRFLNQGLPAAVANVDPTYPRDLVARTGLELSSDTPINPGETREVLVEATDAVWELERLVSFLTDVDSKFGGLLLLYTPNGKRVIAEMRGPIVPVFTELK